MLNKRDMEIAKAWISLQYAPLNSPEHASLFWAFEELDDLVRKNPDQAWSVIQLAQEEDSSEFLLGNLAAGPLEDLLAKHGAAFIERIEGRVKTDVVFKGMLAMVWQNDIADTVWKRVEKLSGR